MISRRFGISCMFFIFPPVISVNLVQFQVGGDNVLEQCSQPSGPSVFG